MTALTPASISELISRVVLVRIHDCVSALCTKRHTGYTLVSLDEVETGLTAHLTLAGRPCNVFGDDIVNLTVQVTYEAISWYVY